MLLRWIAKRTVPLIAALPADTVRGIIRQIAIRKTQKLAPKEGAQFLLALDNDFYPLESEAAINYEGGTHPKHRLTGYHDFFVQRIKPGERVLDVGCRTGEVAFEIASKTGALVTGIDVDAESVEQGKRKHAHANLKLLVGDVYTWRSEEQFDVVLLSNVLEHLKNRSELLRGLRERTGARRFLIRVPLFERDWRAALKRELGMEWRLDNTHEIEYTQEIFADEMTKAGLKIVDQETRWGEIWAELAAA